MPPLNRRVLRCTIHGSSRSRLYHGASNETEIIDFSEGDSAYFGVPWEEAYGYPQAIRTGNSIYVSGQLSHDLDGQIVGAASLGEDGKSEDFAEMALQMQTTYANAAKVLAQFGATLDDVVEETLFVLDLDAAFSVAGQV